VSSVLFFGILGGLIGWLSLKESDRRRADRVLKWGAIIPSVDRSNRVIPNDESRANQNLRRVPCGQVPTPERQVDRCR
jgi:hypothetical protein